ncbi:hypothetical protein PpBr36_01266, partial [Pyricularia pennisetigena]|uniref:hypothetical protein n=1 Tax=Pyricularia pennisetigena TaxID=1578925 RepID=UPI0011519CB9
PFEHYNCADAGYFSGITLPRYFAFPHGHLYSHYFMQQEPLTNPAHDITSPTPSASENPFKDGFPCGPDGIRSLRASSASPGGAWGGSPRLRDAGFLDTEQLDKQLRRLSDHKDDDSGRRSEPPIAGQRVFDYENALTPSQSKHSSGFKFANRTSSPSTGIQLLDLPNETLTHILSHLHPDSHAAVALVSKRFYSLVTTPHAWHMAFMRHFPGQKVSRSPSATIAGHVEELDDSDRIRSEYRQFTRLTAFASWRSEYLLRTRLLRSAARGKPGAVAGGIGSAIRTGPQKRASPVLTYNSKLPWMVSNIHAVFSSSAKKPPKVIQGSADLCVGTLGDPTTGKIERWGLDDHFSFSQLDEVFPNLEPYGVDTGPAATLNVIDVSVPYGIVGGEGFPGGRPYFRPIGEPNGRYLATRPDVSALSIPDDVPKIPDMLEGICSVWVAKSAAVPYTTSSMIGIMTGSTLGVVTSYSLGYDSSGPRYSKGDMTCRWVLSPGVPIIALKVDENYSPKRKALRRVWAVALNALGEVYYLVDTPTPPIARPMVEEGIVGAWQAGRTAAWELVEATRRTARSDELNMDEVMGAYSPHKSSMQTSLTKAQLIAECREIETFFRKTPSDIKKSCEGWDMRRKIEVDFGGDDGGYAGESVVVVTRGLEPDQPAKLMKFTRQMAPVSLESASTPKVLSSDTQAIPPKPHSSLFGNPMDLEAPETFSGNGVLSLSSIEAGASLTAGMDYWFVTPLFLDTKGHDGIEITSVALDNSIHAQTTMFEDSWKAGGSGGSGGAVTSASGDRGSQYKSNAGDLPGRRARMMAAGTSSGAVMVWNVRETTTDVVPLVRYIQTESPEVSSVALSSLYLIHGGSDGLAQAWDILASSMEPIRTLNSRASGRLPRAILNANPMLRDANHTAVGAIYLDPDPAVPRGILAFGTFLRYWTYNSEGVQSSGRKRRSRHHADGHVASRRTGATVMDYIANEAAELRREQAHRAREEARLRSRFGVGLGDLTEEEAIRYAQMISEESFQLDEDLRRFGTSDETGSMSLSSSPSAEDADTEMGGAISVDSSQGGHTTGTLTPEATSSMQSMLAHRQSHTEDHDPDYERQIQQAMRLSLLEAGINDEGMSPRGSSSGEYEFQIKYKPGKKERGITSRRPSSISPSASQVRKPAFVQPVSTYSNHLNGGSGDFDEDLQLALRLSLQDAAVTSTGSQNHETWLASPQCKEDEFPALEPKGKGKRNAA